jgi:hypothetical protein
MHRRSASRTFLNFILHRTTKRLCGLLGNHSLRERVAHCPHLRDVEKLLGPFGREQYAAFLFGGMTDPNFIIDIHISNRHVS